MEKKEYEIMFYLEEEHWWYAGLRSLVTHFIELERHSRPELMILDAGCGTGMLLQAWANYEPIGFDYSAEALTYCRRRNLRRLLQASVNCIPFDSDTFDLVVSLDVIYHAGVTDDYGALLEFYRVLQRGGLLILNLAAFNILKSSHDKAIHTSRRYTARHLRELLRTAGLKIELLTYRNTVLFPVLASVRLLKRLFSGETLQVKSDLNLPGKITNNFLKKIILFENKLIQAGHHFPIGLSIFCIARKV